MQKKGNLAKIKFREIDLFDFTSFLPAVHRTYSIKADKWRNLLKILTLISQAALMWSKKYCDSNGQSLSEILNGFLDYIHFHMIPANVLMKEIHPLGIGTKLK